MQNPVALEIVKKIDDRSVSGAEFRLLIQKFVESLKDCLKKEADAAFATLAPLMASRNLSRASLIGALCGSMVESGCDPAVASPHLTTGLQRSFKTVHPMLDKLERKVRHRLEEIEDDDQKQDRISSGIRQLSIRLPEAAAGLKALSRFIRPALTIYGRDLKGRQSALPHLWDQASQWEDWNPEVAKLLRLLTVLESEKLVAIDVANHKGFVGSFGGAVTNAQLIILLMDTFARQYVFPKALVSHDMVQCANGEGPQVIDEQVQGAWNLYDYRALDTRLKLPDPKDLKANKYWIWNEKRPADIPSIAGYRIILLGPPSYGREWNFEREFKDLKAGIKVESELSRPDLQDWLEKINQKNIASRASNAQTQTT